MDIAGIIANRFEHYRVGFGMMGTAVLLWAIYERHLGQLRWRRLMADLGRCPTCHYDLRQSTDRCPEYGRPIDALP